MCNVVVDTIKNAVLQIMKPVYEMKLIELDCPFEGSKNYAKQAQKLVTVDFRCV